MSSDVFDQAGQRTCSLVQPPGVSRPSLNKQELSPSHVNTRVNAAFILFGGVGGQACVKGHLHEYQQAEEYCTGLREAALITSVSVRDVTARPNSSPTARLTLEEWLLCLPKHMSPLLFFNRSLIALSRFPYLRVEARSQSNRCFSSYVALLNLTALSSRSWRHLE